ncbi:MAG: stage III sporulation protein AG [Dethiobacteria bacterium]|jgi:stage III sporulation protein AG|nr:stage III sporulation protein AG [Bacillota bacterium]
MLDNPFARLKKFFSPEPDSEEKKRRPYTNLLLLLILGIALMLLNSFFATKTSPTPSSKVADDEEIEVFKNNSSAEKQFINELTAILNQIEGVKNVKVFLTFESGPEFDYAQDQEITRRNTLEQDREGGTREIVDTNERNNYVILRDTQGKESALVLKESLPRVRGVLVVAQGVDSPIICTRVVEAVKTALGIPSHRICVLPAD